MDDYRLLPIERYQYYVRRFMTCGFIGIYLLMSGTLLTLIACKESEVLGSISTLALSLISFVLSYYWRNSFWKLITPNLQ